MYFASSDMELLRLAGWCKNLPAGVAARFCSQVFDPSGIRLLEKLELVNITRNGKSIRLRDRGWQLLKNHGMEYHRDTVYKSEYDRRLEMAWLLLTFWRAGFDVFGSTLRDLGEPQRFLHSAAARRNASPGGNIWGGAVFWGLARLGNTIYSCYHVEGHEDMAVHFMNEKTMLDKAANLLQTQGAMFYAGPDYGKLAKALRNNKDVESKGPRRTFVEIRHMSMTPIHLLECSDTGALQLLIMAQKDYRKRLSEVLFRELAPLPPPIGVTEADGLLVAPGKKPIPWMIAVDMDVCRIDRACRQIVTAGYDGPLLLCLPKQAKALSMLCEGKRAKIVALTEDNLRDTFGALRLHEPPPGTYHDAKGEMIDAAHLPVD